MVPELFVYVPSRSTAKLLLVFSLLMNSVALVAVQVLPAPTVKEHTS